MKNAGADKMQFYLPESRDLVDPNYNFRKDRYGSSRISPDGDVYAHELFRRPNCDGYLVSRSVVTPRIMSRVRKCGGIHAFLRVPMSVPVMGDCGAFQYVGEAQPPYTCEEICDYYQSLGFDEGITLDHIVLQFDPHYDAMPTLLAKHPTKDMQYRYGLSLDNAEKMLALTRRHKYSFVPVGSAQGWSPKSYAAAVERLAKVGFKRIALGGLARSSDEVIRSVLDAVGPLARRHRISFHVLGVARFSILDAYKAARVSSCDSAAPILQAFKSTTDSYYTRDGNYTAVRIPLVQGDYSPKVRKMLRAIRDARGLMAEAVELRRLRTLEQKALAAVRGYAARRISLPVAMKHLVRFEDEFAESKRHYPLFEKTLRDRPWEKCPCVICQAIGVEVVILRGNNRNRRRGFHNSYVFYQQFKSRVSQFPV